MNAVFDIKRFFELEKRNLLTHKNQFIYASLIIIGYFVFSVLLTFLIAGVGQIFLYGIYPVCFAVIACAPGFFEKNIRKNNSVFDFILPGSTFEKYMVMLLNYVLLLPVICFAIVFLLVQLTNILPIDMANSIGEGLAFTSKVSWNTYFKVLVVQSFFLTGYMYFKRFSFVKTLLILVGVMILFQTIFMISGAIMFQNMQDLNMVSNQMLGTNDISELPSFQKIETLVKVVSIIMGICFPFGLWLVTFFKLREKEI